MKTAIELIAEERQRQITAEGHSIETDASYTTELVHAAVCYALPADERMFIDDSFVPLPIMWPFSRSAWKPTPENRIRELVKAGALIAAEIEHLQNQKT